jgi:hypothetical protein
VITEPAPQGGAVLDTSQGFFVQCSEMGPTDKAVKVRSLKEWERRFGGRHGVAIVTHDSVRGFFTERGSVLHFARAQGTAALPATATVGVCEATAQSAGEWGNLLSVAYETDSASALLAPAKTGKARKPNRRHDATKSSNGESRDARALPIRVVVTFGDVVEKSTPVTTAGDAVEWSASSRYIRLTAEDAAAAIVATAAVSLAGGTDADVLDEDTVGAALALFPSSLGPGQVAVPGGTDGAIHDAILAHCATTKRCALLDVVDDDAVTVQAEVTALYGNDGAKLAAAMAPRILYQGPAQGTNVLVPYSGLQAGVIARADRATGNPNEAAAGTNGFILGAAGLAVEFTDDEREILNESGVTLAKNVNDVIRTYGSRTCAGPDEPNWMWFANSRVIMAVSYECDAVGEQYVHKQIDAKRKLFTSLEQDLGGVCLKYVTMEALWSFYIDTGPSVNTTDTIANGEIHGVVGVKTSPSAEWVLIEISKQPLNA